MKYPKYPIEPKERAFFFGHDRSDKFDHCPSTSCEKGYSVYCVRRVPCFGNCETCTKSLQWRGRCLCYKRRMILEKEGMKHDNCV